MNTRVRTAWLFLAPMLLLMCVVAVWPLLRSIWFAFTLSKPKASVSSITSRRRVSASVGSVAW